MHRIARIALIVALAALAATSARADILKADRWKGLQADPALKREGREALLWPDMTRNTTVQWTDAPEDLSAFRTLSFYLHSARPTDSTVTLIFHSENPDTEGIDYYSMAFKTDFQGWRHFQVPLESLGHARKPLGWDRIGRVYWSSNWAHDEKPETEVHLSDFTLDTEPMPGFDSLPGEMFVNRSFETGPVGGAPAGWGINTFKTSMRGGIDDTVAHTGRQSVRLTGGDDKARGGLTEGFNKEQTDPDALYRFSAWVKIAEKSAHQVGTSVRFTSVKGDREVLRSHYLECEKGPHDWKRYQWDVRLAPGSEWFNVVLFHHGPGTVWWDDVSLRAIGLVAPEAPGAGALLEDGRVAFQWEKPIRGKLEVAPAEAGFDSPDTLCREVDGTRHTLDVALAPGRFYMWRVTGLSDGKPAAVAVESETGDTAPRFYVGSREQMKEDLMKKYADLEQLYEDLEAFARRNAMWDRFSLLSDFLEGARALASGQGDNPAELKKRTDDTWAELQYTAPWWKKIFLDRKNLFEGLNLEYPGMEKVKDAVDRGDWDGAVEELHAYYVARRKPSYYNKYLIPPKRSPLIQNDARADQYLTHKMPIHSYKTPTYDVGQAFDWHIFPIIDVEWPTKIHRHFHWGAIAAAYWRTGNEKYAEEVVQQLFDWCMDNPMERWDYHRHRWAWSTLNATVRIYSSWIDSWLRIRHAEAWDADAQFVFLAAMREHGRFLMTHAARTGNWVVAEARGLVELGIMFPEFKEAEAWRNEGYRRLLKEIREQVFDDGVQQERTPGYHGMTIQCFMQPVQLGMLNEVDFQGREVFVSKLEKMHEYYLYMANPKRRTAQVGDAHQSAVDSWLRQGYNVFRRLDMLYRVTAGKEGKPPVYRSYAFPNAGQYINRSAWADPMALWGFLDFGGDGGFHCHDDIGHLSIAAYGEFLLIDAGIYAYARPPRLYFENTTGHNTVMVDKKTQLRREPLEAKWVSTELFDVFRGLTDNSEPLLHERTVAFRQPGPAGPGYWLVVDRMSGGDGKPHRMDQRWHPTERMRGVLRGEQVVYTPKDEFKDSQPSIVVAAMPAEGLHAEIAEGFVSYKWYEKIPVDLAQFTYEADAPRTFATVLYPTPPGAPPAFVEIRPLAATLNGKPPRNGDVTALRVAIRDGERTFQDTWAVNHTGEGSVETDGLATDGRVAMVRREGEAAAWLATEASMLRADGRLVFAAAAKLDGAGAAITDDETAFHTTGGKGVRFAASASATINGQAAPAPGTDGLVDAGDVAAPAVAPVPREPGEVRFDLPPPSDPLEPTSRAILHEKGFALPDDAVRIAAAKYSDQGGGAVQITTSKAGVQAIAFLHWDVAQHWLEYTFQAPRAGEYYLYLRACTSEVAVARKVSIGGQTPDALAAVEFLGTGGYSNQRDDWRVFQMADKEGRALAVELEAGDNTVRLENIDGKSLNLDWVAIAPAVK